MKILVTGGAGYIGSHMALMLAEKGYEVVVLDNLSSGFRDAVLRTKLIVGDLADTNFLDNVFAHNKFSAVMHFAASIQVGESVSNPAKYYQNNVVNTLNLLECMRKYAVNKIIFSSSAAVYGEPKYTPIDEKHLKAPLNPYGKTKLMIEEILQDYSDAYGLRSTSLRYFNASGADPKGRLGERHNPETHLIPLILQVASKRRSSINIYGNDYATKDGTCIRDYIHITDLCDAHLLALIRLMNGGETTAYNLGNGNGFSILEVINTVEKVTQRSLPIVYSSRRAGDPAILVANAEKAQQELEWKPSFADLEDIIQHAWRWEQRA